MSLGTKIYTWLKGNLVGEDNKGNKYFCNSKDFKLGFTVNMSVMMNLEINIMQVLKFIMIKK